MIGSCGCGRARVRVRRLPRITSLAVGFNLVTDGLREDLLKD